MLIISHGQACVERGFSENKQALQVNMQKETLVGRRMVKDHIHSIGGIKNFELTSDLLKSCSLGRARYQNALHTKKANDYWINNDLKQQKRMEWISLQYSVQKWGNQRLILSSDILFKLVSHLYKNLITHHALW